MKDKALAALIGVVFGLTLSWTGMSDPDVIRGALTFKSAYLFLFFGSAVVTGVIALQVWAKVTGRAVLREKIERRHITGAAIFGLGWGVTGACPGPIASQIGQGILWAVPLMAGVVIGVRLFLSRAVCETEPANDGASLVAVGPSDQSC